MTESLIPVQGTGRNLETSELTNSAGVVHREGVFIADPTNVSARSRVDTIDEAIVTMSAEHYRIHIGEGFHFSDKQTITSAATLRYLLRNPAANYPHFRDLSVSASGGTPCDIYLYEAPTVTGTGTAQTVRNHNRNTADGAEDLAIYLGPTVSANGTQLTYRQIPVSGLFGLGGGADGDIGIEWILKPSTDYLVSVTNNHGSATATVGIAMFWYEG